MNELLSIYEKEAPLFLLRAAETAPFMRLKGVGMNCGCEYTSFPRFAGLQPYSRFDHSLGVALIAWHFTHDKAQALAGLLHDVATPAFAHVIDFLKGDYLRQEVTEAGTPEWIERAADLQALLREQGLFTDDVADCHRYPVVDSESPRLCADRLEYTLGNLLNYSFRSLSDIEAYYHDLTLTENENGVQELTFRHAEVAESFALGALECSRIYVSDADRYAMQMLSELLRSALTTGYICENDLYGTEEALIQKLPQTEWNAFCTLSIIQTSPLDRGGAWRRIAAKKRCIDPLVAGKGRLSSLSLVFAEELRAFKEQGQEYYVRGLPQKQEENTMKDFLTLAKERYSVRAYKDIPVEAEKIERILTAGKLAPTARNNQPQKIYVVQSEEKRKALAAITPCTFGAPLVFVIAYDDTRSAKGLIYDEYDFGTMDASIVCTHMMLEAAEQGLGSCWVGRFAEADAKKVLGLGEHIHVRALLPVGYAAENAVPTERHEEYRNDTVEYV